MITLGIETSCDETSVAVLKGRDVILSNIVSSSLFRHKPFGGVVPEIASRHCLEQIDFVFEEALTQAKIKSKQIGLIAVTEGPGLIGSLFVGIAFAKALAYQLRKPLVGVNHLDAHLVANFIGEKEPEKYIGLLVSGGHTSLSYHQRGKVRARHASPVLLGSTVDDAAGEAYDKVAKLLGLGYPGGPIIDKLATQGNAQAFKFTKPKQDGRFDFSFSGIKTAVLYEVQKTRPQTRDHRPETINRKAKIKSKHRNKNTGHWSLVTGPPESFIRDMAASFQYAVVSWLVEKTLDAAVYKEVRHIVVGGGVSANSALRQKLPQRGKELGIDVRFPPFILTVDNAAMIARRGYELYQKGKRSDLKLTGKANLVMGKF